MIYLYLYLVGILPEINLNTPIYDVKKNKEYWKNPRYVFMESLVGATFAIYKTELKSLLTNNLVRAVNFRLVGDELVNDSREANIKVNSTEYLKNNMHIIGVGGYQYKLRSFRMGLEYKNLSALSNFSKYSYKEIINLVIKDNKYNIINARKIEDDKQYKSYIYINTQYKQFINKSAMFGNNNRFKYRVEGTDVILTEYLDKEPSIVILPDFVTAISAHAFRDNFIPTLGNCKKLIAKGVRVVANGALVNLNIKNAEFSDSLELIGNMEHWSSVTDSFYLKGTADFITNRRR